MIKSLRTYNVDMTKPFHLVHSAEHEIPIGILIATAILKQAHIYMYIHEIQGKVNSTILL